MPVRSRSVLAAEGKKADELREWRYNAVTSYAFDRDSRFRGLGVGAGLRWQVKAVIGYEAKDDPEAGWISDLFPTRLRSHRVDR